MAKLQMKINGEWLTLPMDFTTGMEQTSPVFNEQGTFSFPFEVPLEPNRHVFKNLADPHGHLNLKHVNGLDAELWFNGILLYKGKTETEGEVELTESVPMTFISGNSDFMSRIDGMNARDVPLDREIDLGYAYTDMEYKTLSDGVYEGYGRVELPKEFMKFENGNISQPYPFPYCNTRICTTLMEKKEGASEAVRSGYDVHEFNRPYSGVCYYVLYFIELLMEHLGISYDKMSLTSMEDMARLAFWMTTCKHTLSTEHTNVSMSTVKSDFPSLKVDITYSNMYGSDVGINDMQNVIFYKKRIYATNGNFPDVSVSEIIEGLENAFGVRFIYDDVRNKMNTVYLKDIFRDQDVKTINAKILNLSVTKYKHPGIRLTYGNEDDTMFSYTEFNHFVWNLNDYTELIKRYANKFDTWCYYDRSTGNAYRVKVDKETGNNPVFFEVGGYNPYVSQDASAEPETINIPFTPLIVNDTNAMDERDALNSNKPNPGQVLAPFVDVETIRSSNDLTETYIIPLPFASYTYVVSYQQAVGYDTEAHEESPLADYDTGFTLGIMRGPGNDSKLDIIQDNYDGEGNDWYTYTVGNYAFTADSIDNYGHTFDYNGTEEGGVDQSGRFSLKLVAEKPGLPIDSQHANRGLVAKFLSEYLYFMERRKLITFDVKMSISDIIHVDFLKRARIGDHVGWINKITYTLGMEDITDVKVEMYTL